MSLTIAYLTSRKEPRIEWFFDSLKAQVRNESFFQARNESIDIIIVDTFWDKRPLPYPFWNGNMTLTDPKPTIWQGEYRITNEDWWAKSNAHNTAIILCETDFIAFVDDRCVLSNTWLEAVRNAEQGNYAVCGSYEKWENLKVENGVVVNWMGEAKCLGIDQRPAFDGATPTHDWYGGSYALPLEWCLQVNGYPEDMCDGLGSEDSMFGILLRNNNYPMRYDPRMKIIEDRTPAEIGGALKRADKNSHLGQKAKSWDIVRCFRDKLTSQNSFDIRDMRARKLKGEDWRPPSASHYDWYDGEYIGDMR